MAQYVPTQQGSGYGKRPLWQWIVIYVVIGVVVYGLVYYFVFANKGDSLYDAATGTEEQNTLEVPY